MKPRVSAWSALTFAVGASALCGGVVQSGAQPPFNPPKPGQGGLPGGPMPTGGLPGRPSGNGPLPGRPGSIPGGVPAPHPGRGTQGYSHPNLTEAARLLTQARSLLVRSSQDRYGNNARRENAVRMTDRAIREVQAAIQQADLSARRRR